MPNRLVDAVSPYLRSHADNPVDWWQWGAEPFAEAKQRQVPVLVSIGYSTCHWCHVMARESFSDPELAKFMNENFVAIKVDREEYPDVDSSYLAAAGAFTDNLGWPLNVFVTPEGRAFFAGTYWPPQPSGGHPAFRQILQAVLNAWHDRREAVESNAASVTEALAKSGHHAGSELPDAAAIGTAIGQLISSEDPEYGGFGTAPKFPMVPVLDFLLASGHPDALALADRSLTAMAASRLRDDVEGGFFRYSTQRDWTDPHYERMLYDNAQLLTAYVRLSVRMPERADTLAPIIEGIAGYLLTTLRLSDGGFASAQDSESTVDGQRVEGGYYKLDALARSAQAPPAIDEKVLTGWNGLAIDALALAGFVHDRAEWMDAARGAADYLIAHHLLADARLARASIGQRVSTASATLEDYGLLSAGLLRLAAVTGDAHYASIASTLVDAAMAAGESGPFPFAVPGGADPVLAGQGMVLPADLSEGAYPSGLTAMSAAAQRLYLLTGHAPYRDAAIRTMAAFASTAIGRPISFGAALAQMCRLTRPSSQLVVVGEIQDSAVASVARRRDDVGITSVLTTDQARAFAAAGFELFEGRTAQGGAPTAYLCRDFVCRLPLTDPDALATELAAG
ncbi:thioredoxin domain-containing protein [Parafrigoribacterium mesophilum]|uniref:thioredoxin domain-containing protein n=1 Tax=Parafrigoribacterium mesophilum TaxID=433646 RepID=UPI0031FBF7BF